MRPGRLALGILLAGAACGPRRAAPPVLPTVPVPTPDTRLDTARATPDTTVRPAPGVSTRAADSAARAAAATPPRPAQRCNLDFLNTPDTRLQSVRDPISGKYTTYVGGGVVGICTNQPIRITSDSAESYEQNRLHYLIGTVRYRENKVALDADRLTYFQSEERLLAEGNVVVTMEDSSSMTGPRAEYFRAVRGVRASSRIVMTARPTLRTWETDSAGKRQKDPVVLMADNIVGEGETLFVAWGTVTVDRADLTARGDSAILDNPRQFSRLMKQPIVESKGAQPFTLVGRVVEIYGRTRQVDRVLAIDSARAVNKDLTLTADTLDLRVATNRLQRAFAFGTSRALAVTRSQQIAADSLDVRMPDQRIRELHAVGQAYAETSPDSTRVISKERDWLRGDTIIAHFDSTARDTTTQPTIVDLVANGNASSFYQVPSNRGEKDRPGVNYVRGRRIAVDFDDKEVNTVTVSDSVFGVFLEATPPDTLSPRPGRPGSPSTRRQPPPTTPVRRPPTPELWHE
jgi:lipopolysaccharide export system protein LptA